MVLREFTYLLVCLTPGSTTPLLPTSDGYGSIFLLLGLGWVGSNIFGLGLENFPLKYQFFLFFPFGVKKSLQVGSKSTRVKGGFNH